MQVLNLCPIKNAEGQEWRFAGIWAQNTPEWALTLLAGMHVKTTIVGFYDAMAAEQVNYILNQTELNTIFCSLNYAQKVL